MARTKLDPINGPKLTTFEKWMFGIVPTLQGLDSVVVSGSDLVVALYIARYCPKI